jgi:nitrilase
MEPSLKVKATVVQAAPVLFEREATLQKISRLAGEASRQGAELILFPEAMVPAYPRGLSFGALVGSRSAEGRALFERYWAQSVDVPGPDADFLGQVAYNARAYLAVGVIERDQDASRGTLFCSLLYFGPDGRLLGKHRKIKPTASERLIWGEGDGRTLGRVDTPFGRLNGLICWENYMPLARMAVYQQGVDIYMAPTADAREAWQASMVHIACEGRCFVLGCNQFVTRGMYPADLLPDLAGQPEVMCRGGSVIVSPFGEVLAGPLFDREGILSAELDMAEVVRGRFDLDVTGHYNRPDIFHFEVR